MNCKLPRFVMIGLGMIAVAVLSAFSSKGLLSSVRSVDASIDEGDVQVVCGGWLEPRCPTTVATAVRG